MVSGDKIPETTKRRAGSSGNPIIFRWYGQETILSEDLDTKNLTPPSGCQFSIADFLKT